MFELADEALGLLGWIAVVPSARQLFFGGTRVSSGVSAEEVCELARSMHCKLLAHGLPTGGAKAGLVADPGAPDLLERAEAFGRAAAGLLTERVVLGKDMGASDALMEAIYRGVGVPQLYLVQQASQADDCPDRIGDLSGYRPHMTGLGVSWACSAARPGGLEGAEAYIQGCGVVGLGTAVRLAENGCRVLGMSDVSGARVWKAGVTQKDFSEARPSAGIAHLDFPGFRSLSSADALLAERGDLLVLAASSSCVDARIAQTIVSPIVVEGANFALTPGARDVLYERDIVVVPDLIASSSSAALVAHQLAAGNTADPAAVWKSIEVSIRDSVASARAMATEAHRSLRWAYLQGNLGRYE